MEGNFGNEKSFLASLSIAKILGIGKQAVILLLKIGVERVKVIKVGENGSELWRYTNGIDEILVIPFYEQKSISTENTFGQDIMNFMHASTCAMVYFLDSMQQATLLGAFW